MRQANIIDNILTVNDLAWSLYNSNPNNEKKRNMSSPEIKTLIWNLEKNKGKYLLVGGFAMAFHGYVRATHDIDLWIKNTPENMTCLRNALLDTGVAEASAMRVTTQLVAGFSMFNLLETDFKADLMHNLKAFKEMDFDKCFERAKISDYEGLKIPVINAADLLREKKEVHREKDIADISFLETLINKLKLNR
jgi:hypothetical protein